jgi:membrane-bound lytic murein transglycosylase D
VLTYAKEHHITPVDPGILFYEIDTVIVKNPLTFDQISEMLHVPMDEIQFLNPAFKQGVIPATPENPFSLRLRKKYIGDFINNEKSLYAYKTKKGLERDSLMRLAILNNRETIEYAVKKGENINTVAKKFHMTVAEIKSLNNLKKPYVKPKQRLLVYDASSKPRYVNVMTMNTSPPPDSSTQKPVVRREPQRSDPAPPVHVVKSGETLTRLAAKYGCSVDDLVSWNNLKSRNLVVGQKIKIRQTSGEPIAATRPAVVSQTKNVKKPATQKFIYHTVLAGETLWDIAEHYDGATVAMIKKLNNITNSQRLKAGQKIRIMPSN